MKEICVLIPAYNPDERLIELHNALKDVLDVIIVDDGSVNKEIFNALNSKDLITHPTNLGKGEALKTGINYIIKNRPNCKGLVTADCDLQHSIADIIEIATQLHNEPDKLYLGSRNFNSENVPFRSKFGNVLMSKFIKFAHNIDVKDTQTGLRGIPIGFAKHILSLKSTDFSFETEMLLETKPCNITVMEIPISTIYTNNNKHSHFNPIKDSCKIVKSTLGRKNVQKA